MKNLVFISFLLLVASCSDPCADVLCVNGECVDGTCNCAEGWQGADCSERIYTFEGSWESTKLSFTQCANVSTLDAVNGEMCAPATGNRTCLRYLLTIGAGGSMSANYIAIRYTGPTRTGSPNIVAGSYTKDGNKIIFCPSSGGTCEPITINEAQDRLTWEQSDKVNGCTLLIELVKS